MSVDRTELACILQRISVIDEEKTKVGESCFYWGQCLKDIAPLPPLNLLGIGTIGIPIVEQVCFVSNSVY